MSQANSPLILAGAGLPLEIQREADRVAEGIVLDLATVVTTVATKPLDTAFTAIRLLRAASAGKFSEQLRKEWDDLKSKGRIKDDYAKTDQARVLYGDTLESLMDENLDAEQLDLLRRLFLSAASEKVTDRNDLLAREYLNIGRSLSTGEIRMVAACYAYLPEWEIFAHSRGRELVDNGYGPQDWLKVMQDKTGLQHVALIQRIDKTLREKDLMRGTMPTNHLAVTREHYRLTDLGFAFCRFLATYDELKEPPPPLSAAAP